MDYSDRVASQIAQYAETVNMHDLPAIFHFWSHRYLLPAMQAVFESPRVIDVYLSACLAASSNGPRSVLSIGCGDGSIEIELAQELIKAGVTDFKIVGADLSPILLGHFRTKIAELQLDQYFSIVEADLNEGQVRGPFDVIMANHSLHHIFELEKLFDFSYRELKDHGVFATCDMIGRNGHMRWPETKAVIDMFWPLLKPKQRYNVPLSRMEETYINHDCSTEGFEGIRAQDILPLMLERFHPLRFVGAGGFVDLMIDRGYGHGFDVNDPDDTRLITCMADLNEIMLDAGTVKPTIMLGHFVKYPCEERTYRGRTAAKAVRVVESEAVEPEIQVELQVPPQVGLLGRIVSKLGA